MPVLNQEGSSCPALLAHLCQGSAIPDGDGYSSQRRRGGEQEAGAPEDSFAPVGPRSSRTGAHRQWTGTGKFADRHGLIMVIPDRNLFPRTTSMVDKSREKIQELGSKN